MKRPVIGIMPSHDGDYMRLKNTYHEAIWTSGGVPLTLSYTTDSERLAQYIDACDGFLFSGGLDLDPALYGEEVKFDNVETDPARDDFEKAIFPLVYKTGKPVLGICRGLQGINVFLGGSLFQHIDGHSQRPTPGTEPTQRVKVVEGSKLHEITGENELTVNTFHHQAINRVAVCLAVDAVAEDGTIEAVHHKERDFFVAVQWHPEIYFKSDAAMQKLFLTFIEKCK